LTYDYFALDAQQLAILAVEGDLSLDGIDPNCNGIGTLNYFDRNVAAGNIDYFYSQPFNEGTSNWLEINVTHTNPNSFTINSEQCSTLLYRVLDGCDGLNPDNPYNLKHGGSIEHPAGTILSITPKTGIEPYCNTYKTGKWIDISLGVSVATSFCNQYNEGSAGQRYSYTYNSGTSSAVTLSILFTQDAFLTVLECIAM
jgi:hypothetical protein